jgi:hypothetical protein
MAFDMDPMITDFPPHAHMENLANRLERQIDRSRAELKDDIHQVHSDVRDLRDHVARQNGRIGKSERAIGDMKLDVTRELGTLKTSIKVLEHLADSRTVGSAIDRTMATMPLPKLIGVAAAALTGLAGAAEGWRALGAALRHLLTK